MLAEITRLRRLCCHPQLVAPGANADSAKLDALIELIVELGEGRHRGRSETWPLLCSTKAILLLA